MFGIGNVFNPAMILGTMAGGPLGAILAQALQQVVSQVVQQIIQKAGEQLGLPQQFIDMAQGAAAGSLGDTRGATQNLQEAISGFVGASGATGAAAGAANRETSEVLSNFVNQEATRIAQSAGEQSSEARGAAGAGSTGAGAGGGSVLMRIALALGKVMDDRVDKMAENATKLEEFGAVDGENMSGYNALTSEMSALGQELKIVGEALNNTLKSIGDSASALARKQ